METLKNTDNKEKMEEKEEKSKGSSHLATGILVHDIVKENLAATTAKFWAAWEAIKKYPNTCKYFEPTQSQLRLIVGSKYSIKDAFEIAGDHNHPCRSCMANEGQEDCFFSTILQDLLRMLWRRKKSILRWDRMLYASTCTTILWRKSTTTYARWLEKLHLIDSHFQCVLSRVSSRLFQILKAGHIHASIVHVHRVKKFPLVNSTKNLLSFTHIHIDI